MSLIFLLGFVGTLMGKIPTEQFNTDCFIVWALFAIADAIWIKRW